MDTQIKIGELKLKNPVLVASGTFGYAKEFFPYLNLKKLGGIITKTITLSPRKGNPSPRIAETASGMLNAIGLQNEGIDNFLDEKMPFLKSLGIPIIVSIGGDTTEENVKLAKTLAKVKAVSALEINISCPNIKGKDCLVSQDKDATYQLVKQVRSVTDKTIITKLSPNVTDIVEIARAAKDAGSDALSLVNTFLGMAIDIDKKSPRLGNITGGLSGPAIKPLALRMVWQVAQNIDIPVIGMGGIMNASDAIEFMIAGANAVCVGTANFTDPAVSLRVIRGIEEYLKKNKITHIKNLIGCLKVNP
ncbi:MAG: dihydroorotate dehydrogenase [Candidatus Omnitrophica bacterium]|nr:dihydroorotate dehydrogenase [Candidatus Omnitrophota bacterium]